jgi:glutathione S-transferase
MEGLAILNYLTRHYDPEFKFSFKDPFDKSTGEQWMAWQHGYLGTMTSLQDALNDLVPDTSADHE